MGMFDKAKTVAAPAPAKAKKEKKKVVISGVERLAAISTVFNALETLVETCEADVKKAALSHFVTAGMEGKKHPESFVAIENDGTVGCELRKRSVRSVLTAEQQALLTEHKVPFALSDTVVETFLINPAYANNAELLERVSAALSAVEGLPEDFIQHQSHKVATVSEETIDAVFKMTDIATVVQLVPVVCTQALKSPKLTDDKDQKRAFALVETLLAAQKSGDEDDGDDEA